MPAGVSPADHFDWDIESMFIDASPRFDTVVHSRSNGRITFEDRAGYTVAKDDGLSGTLDFLDHKTKTRDDWENVTKPRLVLADPSGTSRLDSTGYFCHLDPYPTWARAKEKFDAIHARGRFLLFTAYGPWEAAWTPGCSGCSTNRSGVRTCSPPTPGCCWKSCNAASIWI